MKIVVITTLVHLDVLMVGIATAGIRHQNYTLMTVTASAIYPWMVSREVNALSLALIYFHSILMDGSVISK